MEKDKKHTVEAFLQDELFIQWCSGGSPALDEFWQRWCDQNPEGVPILQRAKEIIQSVEYKEQKQAPEEVYDRILRNVLQGATSDDRSGRAFWTGAWKVAAVLVPLLAALTFYFVQRNSASEPGASAIRYAEMYSPPGQMLDVFLRDGTKVKLNGDSYLRYPQNFGDSTRVVELKGEAYFEVTEDPDKPFIVNTPHLQTVVLGTSFNVHAYPDGGEFHVAVVEGRVRVSESDTNQKAVAGEFVLLKGDKVILNLDEEKWMRETADIASIARWRNGELVFEQAGIQEIARKLQRWYGLPVVPKGEFRREVSFNGIYRNNSINEVLEGIAYSTKLRFVLRRDTVYIEPGRQR